MSHAATPSLTTGGDKSPVTILAGNVTTLADVGDVQGNVEQAHQAHPPGEGEVRLADAGAVPEEPGPTRGVSSTDAGGTVGRTSVSGSRTGDVANVSELAAEAAEHDAEEREALAAPSTWMASEGSRTDGQVMDDLQDAEAQQEAEEAQAIAASGVGSHGDVADVADMADIADDELQADEEAADKGASGVASHGDVADIADVADLLEDEAEAEAEETADARSDAVKFDVGDVADLLEEVESKAGSYSDGAGVASDIADLDVADLEDVYEALDSQDFSEQEAAGRGGKSPQQPGEDIYGLQGDARGGKARVQAGGRDSPYTAELDSDGLPACYVGLAGGGSINDLSEVVREMNTGMQMLGRGGRAADGAGPSSLGKPALD